MVRRGATGATFPLGESKSPRWVTRTLVIFWTHDPLRKWLRRGPAPRGARHDLFPLHQSCRLVAAARRSSQEYCFGRERKDRSEPRALRFLLHNPKNTSRQQKKRRPTRRFARASFERLKCGLIDRERLR
jgi:hypothetical protein